MMNVSFNQQNCQRELDSFQFYTQTRKANIAVTAIIILIGLVGNGLAVFVFAQKRFRGHSSSVYLLCLCLSDGLFLLMHFFEDTLRTYLDVYLQPAVNSISIECRYLFNSSQFDEPINPERNWIHKLLVDANITDRFDFSCGLVNYLRYFLRFVSAYVIIAFTLQRTLAIYWPFFQAKFASKTLAWSIACALCVLGLTLNMWVPFLFKIDRKHSYCDIQRTYSSHYFIITILYITLIMFIPIVVIFVCNTLIIYYVLKASKLRHGMMNVRRSNNISRSSPTLSNVSKVNNHNLGVEEINLISRSGSGSVYTSQHPSYMSHGNGYQPRKQNGQGLVHNSSFSSLKRGGVNGAASSKSSSDSNNKITRMLLLMSFSYAVLNLPYFISWCMFFYHIGFQSASNTLKYYLFSAINLSEIFYVLNYGVHFFIYCASGKKFRQLLRSAFASK